MNHSVSVTDRHEVSARVSAKTLPPGPSFAQRTVDLCRLWNDPWGLHVRYAELYGDVASFGRRIIFLNHPDLIRDLFINDASKHRRVGGPLKFLQGEGLVATDDPLHKQQRQLVEPLFGHRQVVRYGQAVVTWANRLCSRWRSGQIVDVHKEMTHVTLGIVCEALFGVDAENDPSGLARAITNLMEAFPLLLIPFRQYLERLPIASLQRFKLVLAQYDRAFYRLLEQRRQGPPGDKDLLTLFLEAQAAHVSCASSDRQVRDQCTTLLTAGHETTASAMTFALYLLAQHPPIVVRLSDELTAVVRGRQPTPEDLPRLTYTRMIFAEAMRLYPPIWAVSRVVKEPYSIRGYAVKPGTILEVCQYSAHRDRRFFPDPECFLPERFTADAEAARPRFSYFPFGAGPRHCIGESFAWMEGVLLIASICLRYRLTLVSAPKLQLKPCISLRPKHPVLVKVDSL